MKISRFREAFLDKFIKNKLTPSEELFVICNAYKKSRILRVAAAVGDTEPYFRHIIAKQLRISRSDATDMLKKARQMERRKMQYFGTRLREFQYSILQRTDCFPPQTITLLKAKEI